MALPDMSPSAVAIPLDTNGKRKHYEMIDMPEDEAAEAATLPTLPSETHVDVEDESEDEDDEDDQDSYQTMINDYVDHFELDPFPIGMWSLNYSHYT
jgi:hypothetical protein